MSDIAIRVEGLGKRYRIGQRERSYAFRDVLADLATAPWRALRRGSAPPAEPAEIWALKDISFEVRRGEVVGVIGRNGAGKSTLLKILSRITEPTEGYAQIWGTVGSLLEVGTGFHPELTGRENVFLNGAILGMKRSEIARKLDQIVDFAEVETFIDTPVKHYSSGMYMRLAFSVAAHLEADVLLIDEVLAVGDIAFQRKCTGRMESVTREGRSIIMVSHNTGAISRICGMSIWLDSGQVITIGDTQPVVARYLSSNMENTCERLWQEDSAPGDYRIRLRSVRVLDKTGQPANILDVSEHFQIEIGYEILQKIVGARLGFQLMTQDGTLVCSGLDWNDSGEVAPVRREGIYVSRCIIPSRFLNKLPYTLRVAMDIPGLEVLFLEEGVVTFEMADAHGLTGRFSPPLGVVYRPFDWSHQVVRNGAITLSRKP